MLLNPFLFLHIDKNYILILDTEPFQTLGEQELVEEKKKNLSILQSILNVSIHPSETSKGMTKGKIFKYELSSENMSKH